MIRIDTEQECFVVRSTPDHQWLRRALEQQGLIVRALPNGEVYAGHSMRELRPLSEPELQSFLSDLLSTAVVSGKEGPRRLDVTAKMVEAMLGWLTALPEYLAVLEPGVAMVEGRMRDAKDLRREFPPGAWTPVRLSGDRDNAEFLQWIDHTHPKHRDWAQLALTFAVLGSPPGTKFQNFVHLIGLTATGKGVTEKLCRRILGPLATAFNFSTDGRPYTFSKEPLLGKSLAIAPDCRLSRYPDDLLSMGIDAETIERKGRRAATNAMMPRPLLCSNYGYLHDNDASGALARRALLVPFDVAIPVDQLDAGFEDRACREFDTAFFFWLAEGFRRLATLKQLRTPAEVAASVSAQNASSSIKDLVREHLVFDRDGVITREALMTIYKNHCELRGEKPFGITVLERQLFPRGVVFERRQQAGRRVQGYWGVRERVESDDGREASPVESDQGKLGF
jgi:phage/plasmid-associated DNA primase